MTATVDLEQQILRCWQITDDIGEILDDLENGRVEIHELADTLAAYQKVYHRRFNRCWAAFEAHGHESRSMRQRVQELAKDLENSKNPGTNQGKKGRSKQQKEVDH